MSAFIALSLSTYMICVVLASYLTRTMPAFILPILLASAAIFSLIFVLMSKKAQATVPLGDQPVPRRWKPWGMSLLLIVLVFLPGSLALLLSTRMQISVHGFFHSAYTYQILHGMVPPENVTLPGYPANNYWPYHAILAVFDQILNVPPPLASAWLNILSLGACLALSYQLIRLLIPEISIGGGFSMALVGLFGMNLFGGFHTWVDGDQDFLRPAVLMGDYRVAHVYDKFLNFSAFSVGILLFLYVLVILAGAVINRRFSRYDTISLSLAGLGALLAHATTGLFMGIVLPVALLGVYLFHLWRTPPKTRRQALLKNTHDLLQHLRSMSNLLILALIGVVAATSLYSVYQTSAAMPVKSEVDWFSLFDIQSMLGVIYPLLPFFLLSMVWAWRRNSLPVLLLGFIYLLGSGLALVTALPDGNDYKFIVLANISACFAAAYALAELFHRKKYRILPLVAIALTVTNILMLSAFRLSMDWFSDPTFRYQGAHATAAVQKSEDFPDLRYADLFLWARDATPVNTVIIVPRLQKDRSALFLLSERVPFYADGDIFNRMPEKRARIAQVEDLYKASTDGLEKLKILKEIRAELPERPLLFVQPHDLINPPQLNGMITSDGFHPGELADAYLLPALEPRTP